MQLGLQRKVALVNGAGSQICMGKAIALALAKEVCDVIITDIDLDGAEKTGEEVRALGKKAYVKKANVLNNAEVVELVEDGIKELGKIDILINAAGGITFSGFLAEAALADIEHEINLNLMGTVYCTKAVLPGMTAQKSGKIVNISSNTARTGMPGGSGYSAAKTGVVGFTRAIAGEGIGLGINVNAIAPGLVLTNFYSKERAPQFPPSVRETEEMPGPGGGRKVTTVDDVANLVLFLVSDISSNITAQTLSLDGGQTSP